MFLGVLFFFKQRTAYEMRISDWSSDVCSSDLGESGERVAIDAHHGPFVHQLRAEALVKADRRGVPVEHPPFEPRAVAFDAELGEMREQRLAEPRAARFGAHEQIFEIDAGASLAGREIVEEEREALWRAAKLAEHTLGTGERAEKHLPELPPL